MAGRKEALEREYEAQKQASERVFSAERDALKAALVRDVHILSTLQPVCHCMCFDKAFGCRRPPTNASATWPTPSERP